MAKRRCIRLLAPVLCAALLAACAWPAPTASAPAATPQPPVFDVYDDETDTPAPLPAITAPGAGTPLSAAPVGFSFGKQRDGENRPLLCLAAEEQYGGWGFLAFGPETDAVYLTFDFGFETGYSGDILDTLQKTGAKATFFVVGHYLDTAPDAVRRMVEEGHSVGGHSVSHPAAPGGLAALSAEERRYEIAEITARLSDDYGYESRLFRFPEGIYSEAALAGAAALGQYSVFWSYGYADWDAENQPDEAAALQNALDAACPGAIYLLHPQKTNAAILERLILGLRNKGYRVCAL